MNKFEAISIGNKFNLYTSRDYYNQTGCLLEQSHSGNFDLLVFLSNMSKEEKLLLRKAKMTVKIFKDSPEFIKTLIQFGNTDFIFEMNFNPLLYTDNRRDLLFKSNMIFMIGIESTDYIIKTLRYFNMPRLMYLSLLAQYESAKKIDDYNKLYNKWHNDIERRYSVLELWEMGRYVGKMGEEILNK